MPSLLAPFSPPAFVEIIQNPNPGTLLNSAESGCPRDYIPDAPFRAFRRNNGIIVAMAADSHNWLLNGNSLLDLRASCASALESHRDPDFSHSDYESWIEAIYAERDGEVTAFVSQAVEGDSAHPCENKQASSNCWLNNITMARSTDAGLTFHLLSQEERVLAESKRRFSPVMEKPLGFITTTNIVHYGGFYYDLIFVRGDGEQKQGNCLFRGSNLASPNSWFAWSGKSFQAVPRQHADRAGDVCEPVSPTFLDQPARSLSYVPRFGLFLTVFTSRRQISPGHVASGVFYSMSPDLLNWSQPKLLLEAPLENDPTNCSSFIRYPAVIDPDDPTVNFENVGETAFLTYTYEQVENCQGTWNREIRYLPIRIKRLDDSLEVLNNKKSQSW